ncbi:SIMPL domain-containing protein [Flavihumibacter petaseus]|uniref:SIMPL domain-containing protein n=1 Tax=Flavihumibacter petaseus NBRC 106054 TaxID=1220578 RepID=A0A0E9MZG6_9BACT|nr:SIMPL domain-containing protein [Flavihumibacter petaseus]GAO42500.1 hypothetical protein FPE01S_01_15140 [Flavihumibacter petaseus NBRC 106054]
MIRKTLALALIAFGCSVSVVCGQSKNFIDQPYLEVHGEADSLVTPNQIFIRIILSEKDTKDKISLEEMEIKMVNALKSLGVNTDTKLRTSDQISNYKYYFMKSRDIIKTKQYLLEINDATTASKVFMTLEDLDISNTSIDHVDHTELEAIRNSCRIRAVLKAKEKANAMSQALGQNIGRAIQITDVSVAPVRNALEGRIAGVVVRGYGTVNKDKLEPPKIEFEKIPVSVGVNTIFILN